MTSSSVISPSIALPTARPLCIDLDGTLVKSDTFIDSLLVLARRHPAALLKIPLWMLKGKAFLRSRVAAMVTLDAEHLPYNAPLLHYLRKEYASGRKLYLASNADPLLAVRIADYLGIFEQVLAGDGAQNMVRNVTLARLQQTFSHQGFDYIGNAMPDLPMMRGAKEIMLANPHLRLQLALKNNGLAVSRTFLDRSSPFKSFAKALRLHQWAKNVLVFLPLLLAHSFRPQPMLSACAAFFCFCLIASSTYILNDLLDLEVDRVHVSKRRRAFAAGDMPVTTGLFLSAALATVCLLVAVHLPKHFMFYLLLYLVTTLAYSLKLKRLVLVDVVVLSGLYTVRMTAGSAATHIPISPWLAAFSIFFFLSLAMVKRFSELLNLHARGVHPTNARGYLLSDIEQLRSFGTATGYASVVVFALYINGRGMAFLYRHPARMWLIVPILILWISRVWLLASRGKLHEDPVVFALTDRVSLLLGCLIGVVAWSAL